MEKQNSLYESAEALKLIQDTATQAAGARGKVAILEVEQDPNIYYLVTPEGKHERIVPDPDPRCHKLGSIDQVANFVNFVENGDDHVVVWYSQSGVSVICDDRTRRDSANLRFNTTPQYRRLVGLGEASHVFEQKEFVRFLRIELADCLADERLLKFVRECRFQSSSQNGGSVQHGKESLGIDIEAHALNPDDCPEEIVLNVRVFDDPSLKETWQVKCAVELLVQQSVFRLTPLPMELTRILDHEMNAIGKYLDGECNCAVFHGSP